MILFGLMIFWLFCPSPIRRYRSRREYVDAVPGDRDEREGRRAAKILRSIYPPDAGAQWVIYGIRVTDQEIDLLAEPTGVLSGSAVAPLTAYYEVADRRFPVASGFCLFYLVTGAVLFLVPSFEVFIMAMSRLIRHTIGID